MIWWAILAGGTMLFMANVPSSSNLAGPLVFVRDWPAYRVLGVALCMLLLPLLLAFGIWPTRVTFVLSLAGVAGWLIVYQIAVAMSASV